MVLALSALAGCASASVGGDGSSPQPAASDGPLTFPDGFGLMRAPRRGSSYAVFEACGAAGNVAVRLVRVRPVRLAGAESVAFEAAWPVPGQRPLPGGGGLPLPRQYQPSAGAEGVVNGCGNPPASLEIAAVFPPAETADVVVDGIEVVYEVDGRRYTETADVTLGICATDPGWRSEHCR